MDLPSQSQSTIEGLRGYISEIFAQIFFKEDSSTPSWTLFFSIAGLQLVGIVVITWVLFRFDGAGTLFNVLISAAQSGSEIVQLKEEVSKLREDVSKLREDVSRLKEMK